MSGSRAAVAYWLARDAHAVSRALDLDGDALRARASRRLRALLDAAARAPFHASRMRDAGLLRAHALPDSELSAALAARAPVTKRELRDAGPAAFDGGRISGSWFSSLSSGSSGEPFRVHYTPRAWATLKHLVKLRSRRAAGMRLTDRVAILDAVALEQEGVSPLERAGRVRRISVFRPAAQVAAALAAFRPDVIYALPSALLEVARAHDDGAPRGGARHIFTSGELLTAAARITIERSFGAKLSDVYGTSETKEIAWECSAGSRHVNADVVLAEILADDGSVAPAGAEGDIVVTLLVNSAMPLVRYRTGDRGAILAGDCSCGRASPLLGVVLGREVDVLELPDGSTRSPYSLTMLLERIPALVQYQVVQTERDVLRVTAIAARDADRDELSRSITDALRGDLPPDVRIEVVLADHLSRGARAKIRVVQPLAAAQ
ncbi:MAG: phenylacetate--CoA ligase family protein [Gemmatimonadales bacterium]